MKTVLITGVTSGIGRATAILLAQKRFKLIICGRRTERLRELAFELGKDTEVMIRSFDVRDRNVVNQQLDTLPDPWKKIDILINNAGNAYGLAPVHEGDLEDWDNMIDINVKGLLYVSRKILPGMVERKSGHIINIGSIAGKEAYANGNVYCASKFAVDAITQGMRIDLNDYNIRVGAVNPGLVETEFSLIRFKGDEQKAAGVYDGMTPLTAEDIAEILLFIISRPSHVNIADLLVLPTAQATATKVHRNPAK